MPEDIFRKALDFSLDGFALLQPVWQNDQVIDFSWYYVNKAAHQIFRLESFSSESLLTVLPVKNSNLFNDLVGVVKTGNALEVEVKYETRKTSGWLRLMAVCLEDKLAITFREITERKIWEEQIKQIEARFRLLSQSDLIGLLFWDNDGTVLDGNEAFLKIIGRERDALEQRLTWKEITPPEYWERDALARKDLTARGVVQAYEKECLRKDGTRVPVMWGVAKVPAVGYEGVAYVLDISERKEAEKQREILLGHELKTPLAGIKGFAQLLKGRFTKKGDYETVEYLSKIDKKVDQLSGLVSDFTDLSRIRSDKMVFQDEIFWFDDLVGEIVADFRSSIRTHQILLEGKCRRPVLADKARLGQVITNLLSNAVKYSPAADKIIVKLAADKAVSFSVQDFGLGMSPGEVENIFQPFGRAESSKKLVPGVGLGLYITSEIVKNYGGRIKVASRQGAGSTFTVTLPLLKPAK